MRQYQTVIVKLSGKARDDEEAFTDLLNERARTGWQAHQVVSLGSAKLLAIFWRDA